MVKLDDDYIVKLIEELSYSKEVYKDLHWILSENMNETKWGAPVTSFDEKLFDEICKDKDNIYPFKCVRGGVINSIEELNKNTNILI